MFEYDTLKDIYIPQIARLESKCIPMPWSENAFEQELLKDNVYYSVALTNGKVVGFIGIYTVCDEADITNIAVDVEYRYMGIAAQLVKNATDYCSKNGISFVTLEVRSLNYGAIKFYEKSGFVKTGLRKRYYRDTNEDAVIMNLNL